MLCLLSFLFSHFRLLSSSLFCQLHLLDFPSFFPPGSRSNLPVPSVWSSNTLLSNSPCCFSFSYLFCLFCLTLFPSTPTTCLFFTRSSWYRDSSYLFLLPGSLPTRSSFSIRRPLPASSSRVISCLAGGLKYLLWGKKDKRLKESHTALTDNLFRSCNKSPTGKK